MDPLAIGSLPTREPLSGVELRGRVIALQPVTVADETGTATIELTADSAAPPLGAWVIAHGDWKAGRLRSALLDVVAAPARAFGSADSEWAHAQPDRLVALRLRHAILRLTRQFFDEQGFTEVETPAVVRSPGVEPHLRAFSVIEEAANADAPRYLNTSPEYHMKRLLSAGMSRVYQCAKVYRAGEVGALHQPEFTMLEWYRAFSDMEAMIVDTELLLCFVVGTLRSGQLSLPATADAPEVDITPPWERMRVEDAFARYADCALAEVADDQARFDRVLIEQIEPQLGRTRPTVLTHYPARMASLARLSPAQPEVAERFEVYVHGVELCNGFAELTDPVEQRARLQADLERRAQSALPAYPIDERFLAALADGIPPSGGNALGFDRLVMLVLGADRIDEVIAFPADRI